MWVNVPVALFARCAADIAGMVSHGLDSVMDKFVSTEKVGYAYEWHKCHHLRYAFTTPAVREGTLPLCQSCCQPNEKLLKCPKCGMGYCSKECQKRDWKKHKKKHKKMNTPEAQAERKAGQETKRKKSKVLQLKLVTKSYLKLECSR